MSSGEYYGYDLSNIEVPFYNELERLSASFGTIFEND